VDRDGKLLPVSPLLFGGRDGGLRSSRCGFSCHFHRSLVACFSLRCSLEMATTPLARADGFPTGGSPSTRKQGRGLEGGRGGGHNRRQSGPKPDAAAEGTATPRPTMRAPLETTVKEVTHALGTETQYRIWILEIA
jgi:hypothetical protein